MRNNDVPDDICGSRGPRIGDEQPVCKEPRYHETRHAPGEDDGWGDLTWSDHAICGRTNMEQRLAVAAAEVPETPESLCRWLLTLDDPEDVIGREERRTVSLTAIIQRARIALADPPA